MIQEAYIQGISRRSVDDLVKALGMSGISKSQVSRLCEEIDDRVKTFLERYLWIDATYTFPAAHRAKLHSTNPIERLNGEIKRRTEVLGISPTKRPSPALLERSSFNRMMSGPCSARYMTLETIAPLSDDPIAGLPAVAA